MDLTEPSSALVPGLTVPLLRALASRGGSATSEQLRRVAEVGTAAGVRRALERMAEHGLLLEMPVGARGTLYELNREHVLIPALQLLLVTADVLFQRMRNAFDPWRPAPVSAALFGSAARRDGDIYSDIDLLLVRPDAVSGDDVDWEAQVHLMRDQVWRWTGNHLQVLERSKSELAELVRAGEPIVAEWQEDAVTLCGRDLAELVGEVR